MTKNIDFLAPLADLLVLRIGGDDAVSFLHAQLSNDISGIGPGDARLAAYCNAKGRMLGSLILWQEMAEPGSPLLALVKADLLEPLLKRLRMFVLRSKVNFEVTDMQVYGVIGPAVDSSWPAPAAPWIVERDSALTRISAPTPTGGPSRWWVVAQKNDDTSATAGRLGLGLGEAHAWLAQDIRAGLGWVEQANIELFIPQSMNYDLIGGVSFTKGCYPGQEIVARAHFRGTVKRRAIPGLVQLPDDIVVQAGMDIFDAQRPASPAGRIINAATGKAGGGAQASLHLLMEVSLADIGHADFRVSSPEGPAIALLPLPYPLEVKE